MHVWVKLNWTDLQKFNNPNHTNTNRRSEETSPTRVSSDTASPDRSQHRWFIYPSVSQSGRNRPLGVDFEGQGGEKTKGGNRGTKHTRGRKVLTTNRSLS